MTRKTREKKTNTDIVLFFCPHGLIITNIFNFFGNQKRKKIKNFIISPSGRTVLCTKLKKNKSKKGNRPSGAMR